MATSPIYSWPEPDNTDLVKNGALAIRTMGNAIDTTMGTMVAKTVVDAKGDLIAGTAADTVNRLAVGSNGETLVADSSTSTGLRWQSPTAQQPVINSSFQIWQRGTTSTANNTYATADRWWQGRGAATASWSQVTTGLPTGFQYAMKVQRTAGQTSGDGIYIQQVFETLNSIPFAGKTVTLSFYAKAGANYSPTGSKVAVRLYTGTGTDQAAASPGGWTGYAEPIAVDQAITTTWTRYTMTGTLASTATQIGMVFYLFGTGTAGADDAYQITGVQLEVGSVATPFKTYAANIAQELAACQRYYFRHSGAGLSYAQFGLGTAYTTTKVLMPYRFPVQMRGIPSAIEYAGPLLADAGTASSATVSTLTLGTQDTTAFNASIEVNTAGAYTIYRPYTLCSFNSSAPYIGFSAEI